MIESVPQQVAFIRRLLFHKEYIRIQIMGYSMYPILEPKDYIYLKKQNRFDIGELVLFYNRQDRTLIIHRIIRITNYRIVTKGDNNVFLDESISLDDVIGVAYMYERKNQCYSLDVIPPLFAEIFQCTSILYKTYKVPKVTLHLKLTNKFIVKFLKKRIMPI